jgi:membrane-bound lytic murein transglycosylase MltF
MGKVFFRRALYSIVLFLVAAVAQSAAAQEAQLPEGDEHGFISYLGEKWAGDLDGIQKRRMLRVLLVYSKTFFFIDKGTPRGMHYDGMMNLEKALNRKLKTDKRSHIRIVFIPVRHDELLPALMDGRGDIAVANLTVTAGRQAQVDFSLPYLSGVRELVVTGSGVEGLTTLEDLADRQVFVRPTSSYYEHILELNRRFKEQGLKPVRIVPTPPQLEEEDLLEMVNAGIIPITVVDSHIADFWKQIFDGITVHENIAVNEGGEIALAMRKDCPRLKAVINELLSSSKTAGNVNMLLRNYLKNTRWVKNAASEQEMQKFRQMVDLFKKYADQYQFDYLLLTAQGYQESALNQSARSPVGAIGIMQIMPATGSELGVGDIRLAEPNIHGGAKYMRKIMDEYFSDASFDDLNRNLFAFAAYNAGPNRIARLRKTAAERGYDPNIWFDNVEHVVAEKVGQEPVRYVGNIFKYYVAYKLAEDQRAEARALKDAVKEALPLEAAGEEEKAGFFKRIFKGIF